MTNDLEHFDRAASAADSVFAGVRPEQLGDPTPCTEWNVRQLMNHVVGGNRVFLSMQTGGEPVDRSADFLGDDPHAAFSQSVADLRAAFAVEGALERIVPTPFGEQPAAMLVRMRVNEMMLHGWDLARATGQSTDLDPELAEQCIEDMRRLLARSGGGAGMFQPEQSAPDGATAADRLAALAGRAVS